MATRCRHIAQAFRLNSGYSISLPAPPSAPVHWSSLRPTGQASQMELPTSPNAPQKVAWHLFFPFVVRDLQTLWPFFLTFPEPFTAFDRER